MTRENNFMCFSDNIISTICDVRSVYDVYLQFVYLYNLSKKNLFKNEDFRKLNSADQSYIFLNLTYIAVQGKRII